jgi:hypothetical protein
MTRIKLDLGQRIFEVFLEANNFKAKADFKNRQIVYELENRIFTENNLKASQAYKGFLDGFTGRNHLFRDALNMPSPKDCDYDIQYNLGRSKRRKV